MEPVSLLNSGNLNLTAYGVGDAPDEFVTIVNKTHTSTRDATDLQATIVANGFGPASCAAMTLTDGTDGDASLMTASLGGASITNQSRWQGKWQPLAPALNGQCIVNVPAASAVVLKLEAPGTYSSSIQINQNGALEIFAVDGSGTIWHNWQKPVSIPMSDKSNWSGWTNDLNGAVASGRVVAARNLDNTLELFAPTASGDVYHAAQNAPGGAWSSWLDMGASSHGISNLVAANNADGSLTVFGIGSNGDLWYASESAPGVGWSSWTDMAGSQIQPGFAVAQDLSGGSEVVGVDASSNVLMNVQTSSGAWSGWSPLLAGVPGERIRADLHGKIGFPETAEHLDSIWSPQEIWMDASRFSDPEPMVACGISPSRHPRERGGIGLC